LLVAAASAQQRVPDQGVNFYSIEKETALGRQLAAEFTRDHKPLESPAAQAYINKLGQRLATQLGGPPFTYTFALFADNTPYSEVVTFPGGFVFVPSSIVLAAKDESELAGILAHSLSHIAARHATKQATKAELVNVASVPLIDMGGWTGYAIRQGADLAIPLGLLQQWRRFELQADALAARNMAALGYDPEALVRFVDREEARFDDPRPNWASSPLPPRAQRLEALRTLIADLPPQSYAPHEGLDKIQEEVRRLTAGPAPSQKPPRLVR
jgi:predicted Zn-dependent protease